MHTHRRQPIGKGAWIPEMPAKINVLLAGL
jgi:hypothetical protein